MTDSRSSREHADHDLARPALDQHARRGEWVEPGVEDDATPRVVPTSLRSAIAEAREGVDTTIQIARALPRPVQIAAAAVGGLLALAVVRRVSRGRRPRASSASGRVVRELGREIVGRAALAAATTLAARLTQELMLPMVEERLALRAERMTREAT